MLLLPPRARRYDCAYCLKRIPSAMRIASAGADWTFDPQTELLLRASARSYPSPIVRMAIAPRRASVITDRAAGPHPSVHPRGSTYRETFILLGGRTT